jgi:hypothetical protein
MLLKPRDEGKKMIILLERQVTHDVVRLKKNILTIPWDPSEMFLNKGKRCFQNYLHLGAPMCHRTSV